VSSSKFIRFAIQILRVTGKGFGHVLSAGIVKSYCYATVLKAIKFSLFPPVVPLPLMLEKADINNFVTVVLHCLPVRQK